MAPPESTLSESVGCDDLLAPPDPTVLRKSTNGSGSVGYDPLRLVPPDATLKEIIQEHGSVGYNGTLVPPDAILRNDFEAYLDRLLQGYNGKFNVKQKKT